MIYTKARRFIKTGDVLSFRGTWFFSKLIRWYTRSDISHVGIAVWLAFYDTSIAPTLFVLEAMEGYGVRLIPLSKCLREYWDRGTKVYWQRLREDIDGTEVIAYALRQTSRSYANFFQFLRIIRGRGGDTDSNKFHCSELVTNSLIRGGYVWNKSPALTTPGEVTAFPCLSNREELEYDEDIIVSDAYLINSYPSTKQWHPHPNEATGAEEV